MPSCVICKKSVTTGFVLCGHCAKGLAPYTLPTELAWFIDQLSEKIVQDKSINACYMCALGSCHGQVSGLTCKNGVKAWLLSRAKEAFFATTDAKKPA